MINSVKNIEEHEPLKLFKVVLYSFLILHNFYHVVFLGYIFSLDGFVFETTFLILLSLCIIYNQYKKKAIHHSKYFHLIISIFYLMLYDYFFINMFENKYSGPYLEFF